MQHTSKSRRAGRALVLAPQIGAFEADVEVEPSGVIHTRNGTRTVNKNQRVRVPDRALRVWTEVRWLDPPASESEAVAA